MPGPFAALFSREIFMPRGHEYLWTPRLLVLEGGASLLLGLGWLVAALSLARRARARRLPSRRTQLVIGVGLVAVALTHLFDLWLIWAPVYWLDSLFRSAAALLAVAAAIASITDRGDS